MTEATSGWGEFPLEESSIVRDFTALRLWIKRPPREFALAYRYYEITEEEDGLPSDEAPPHELDWLRWAVESASRTARLSPVFPDLPVVVRPGSTFRVAKGCTARIFVRVPVWIEAEFQVAESHSIRHQIPSRPPVKTWSGGLTEGEVCYWNSTSARREVSEEMFKSDLVVCPVDIRNESLSDLLVERLTLRVPHLSLFLDGDRLWSDETQVLFRGAGKGSQIKVSGSAPAEAPGASRVTPPRWSAEETFSARTFSWIKDLPGLGLIS